MWRGLIVLFLAAILLGGCNRAPVIDTRYSSQNHDSRVQYVILHYTSSDFDRALQHLTVGEVSSHYLIDTQPVIYRLVDEDRRAWHAGESSWQGRTWLNGSSIGIELVHFGYTDGPAGRYWHPWSEAQIDVLIPLLQDILRRHGLGPEHVLGHSDVAPQRKVDPGPLFPWQRLAKAGVAVWPEAERVADNLRRLEGQTPPMAWFEEGLQQLGFSLQGAADQVVVSRNVLAAFQMRFRPSRFDGQPDVESAAILAALVPNLLNSALLCKSAENPSMPRSGVQWPHCTPDQPAW